MNNTATALNAKQHDSEPLDDENNSFSVRMAGQVRAIHKRRKNRVQRLRSRRR